jgi:UDP-galactopyranose mutase
LLRDSTVPVRREMRQEASVEPNLPIVVYSHLRWDSVFQRPQHLMSRFAKRRAVLFIEEPVTTSAAEERNTWRLERPDRNLAVCRPFTPITAPGFDAAQIPDLLGMSRRLLAWRGIGPHIAWLYTPLALPLARALLPDVLVYDCMDELSAFQGAPAGLAPRERELLSEADVVFTGGRSLYRAKKDLNANVRCFPSSVDAAHFARALAPSAPEPGDQAALPHPRLGYFGVLDERLDLELLAKLAAAEPSWQIVLVGPVAKIDPVSLPKAPNLHYLGQRRYEELPAYLAGWDVCLLPFARNAATRFISPTKTLEYMAAERPIVSTPIRDVAEPYGDAVYLGETPDEFVAACRRALGASAEERLDRFGRMRAIVAGTSWDATVQAMNDELDRLAQRRPFARRQPALPAIALAPQPRETPALR